MTDNERPASIVSASDVIRLALTVEVCALSTCRFENSRLVEETLNLLAGGRYILRDGGSPSHLLDVHSHVTETKDGDEREK